ncbi:MAG: hypothetical protein DCC65_12545 [Planctomycetota bacterium]|nr:MAG: hypothetical protein DCC65_12545 [Planctomycetota bacterium]
MTFEIAPIVEGHGDVAALPVLLRRLAPELHVKRPVRFPRSRLLIDEHLNRAARIAASNISMSGAVLLMIDADEDCAARLGPQLEQRLARLLPQTMCRVVLPVKEFEAWIVGGDSEFDIEDADCTGDLKGLIRERRGEYSEAVDQPRLIANARIELLARRSRSFRRLQAVVREFQQAASIESQTP